MPSSVVRTAIVNTALAHLGEAGFDSIDVDPAPPKLAKALAQLDGEAGAVDWVLRQYPWLCAMAYKTVSRSGSIAENWKYGYAFELPSSALRLWEVRGACAYEAGTVVVEGAVKKVVWADAEGPLELAYVERKPLEAMTPDVIAVIALELAARCAGPIQGKYERGRDLHKAALAMMEGGAGNEVAEQGGQDPVYVSDFARLRASAG